MTDVKEPNEFSARVAEQIEADAELRDAYQHGYFAQQAASLIRAMRMDAGISQKELAALMGVQPPRISEAERGGGKDGPTYRLMYQIADACGFVWPKAIDDLERATTHEPSGSTKVFYVFTEDEVREAYPTVPGAPGRQVFYGRDSLAEHENHQVGECGFGTIITPPGIASPQPGSQMRLVGSFVVNESGPGKFYFSSAAARRSAGVGVQWLRKGVEYLISRATAER